MIGEQPIEKGDEPVRTEALPRAASAIPIAMPNPVADVVPGVRPGAAPRALGVRRISFAAWGLAGIAGVALWVALFKFA